MLNMMKRLYTNNHHQLYVQDLSVNLQSMPTISSLSSSTFSLPPLYVFLVHLLLTHLYLCTCLSPHPPSLPYLYTSSYLHVCLCPPCIVSLSLSSLSLSSLSPSSLLVDEKLKAAPNHNLPSSSPAHHHRHSPISAP